MGQVVVGRAVGVAQLDQTIVVGQVRVGFTQIPRAAGRKTGKRKSSTLSRKIKAEVKTSGSSGQAPFLHLAGSGLFVTVGHLDRTTDVDVVIIVGSGEVVEAADFGERRQVKRKA